MAWSEAAPEPQKGCLVRQDGNLGSLEYNLGPAETWTLALRRRPKQGIAQGGGAGVIWPSVGGWDVLGSGAQGLGGHISQGLGPCSWSEVGHVT